MLIHHLPILLSLATTAIVPGVVKAQSATQPPKPPITKILAIGTITSPLTEEDRKSIMPGEVRGTVELYLQGKIDQWWFRGDGKGVVFLLNMSSVEEAHVMLEKLPLGVAKRMTFELMPLGPLVPLRLILGAAPDNHPGENH